MKELNFKRLIETDLSNLRNKYQAKFGEYPLLSGDSVPNDGIIFIGLNPSISEKEKSEISKTGHSELFYEHNTTEGHKHHRYFLKFIELAKELNLPWGHIDLLYMRETQQSTIGKLINSNDGLDFIWEQLQISKKVINEIIDKARPKVFIVNNSLSRKFLGLEKNKENNTNVWMGFDFDWDDSIGTYKHKGIPFFFTSMLTGQRALDNGSYERLIWHVKHALGMNRV